jgi:hypothetical protein
MGLFGKIHRNVIFLISILLFSILLKENQLFINTQSQFDYFPNDIGVASLIPYPGQDDLSLLEASVIVRAELEDMNNFNMPISFNCSYKIYNPATTVNASFLLPITHDFLEWEYMAVEMAAFTAWINDTQVTLYGWLNEEFPEEIEEELGYSPYYGFHSLNASDFQGGSIINIELLGLVTITTSSGRSTKTLSALYDLRTLHHWGSYSKQEVEFRVDGIQPFSYSNYSDTTPERKCLVTHYESGTSYYWSWENENIIENNTIVQWVIPREKPFTFLVDWDLSSLLFVTVSSLIIILVNRIKIQRKSRFSYD